MYSKSNLKIYITLDKNVSFKIQTQLFTQKSNEPLLTTQPNAMNENHIPLTENNNIYKQTFCHKIKTTTDQEYSNSPIEEGIENGV